MLVELIRKKASMLKKRVVFADVGDDRLYNALKIILKEKICFPVLVGDTDVILGKLRDHRIPFASVSYVDPATHTNLADRFAKIYSRLREKKRIKPDESRRLMVNPVFFGAMLVREGFSDGMVSGLRQETKPFIPAFHIIGLKKGYTRVSGIFIIETKSGRYYFADCAVNIAPDERQLAEIALLSGETARMFGDRAKIAMLSFSTHGSARHPLVDKVANATAIARKLSSSRKLNLLIDGEMQFDAAFVPDVQRLKVSRNILNGQANVFIFPDLNSGNISYKIAERMGGATATGPILQGLKKPINDLSRGASPDDIANVAAITCFQTTLIRDKKSRTL